MSAVVVSTPPPTVMNTIDSAVSRGIGAPSISWWVIALMASSRGECTRSAISSRMRTMTLPNCTCAALCSGVPREYAATLWNASVIMLQSSSGNPSHSSVTAPGTGTDSSCVNSHSPASMNWSMKCVVQCSARGRSFSAPRGANISESTRRTGYQSGGSISSGVSNGRRLCPSTMELTSGSVRADEKCSQSRNAAATSS